MLQVNKFFTIKLVGVSDFEEVGDSALKGFNLTDYTFANSSSSLLSI